MQAPSVSEHAVGRGDAVSRLGRESLELGSIRSSIQSRPRTHRGIPPNPMTRSVAAGSTHRSKVANQGLLQTLSKLEAESENRAFELINLRTLVLKVEKEREDALAQVKKLTEQNAELQEEVGKLTDEVNELQRERTAWKVGEWLEGASGLSHVRAAGAAAPATAVSGAAAGSPTRASLTPAHSHGLDGGASSSHLQVLKAQASNVGTVTKQPATHSGAAPPSTAAAAQPAPASTSELDSLRAQVQELESQLAAALAAAHTDTPTQPALSAQSSQRTRTKENLHKDGSAGQVGTTAVQALSRAHSRTPERATPDRKSKDVLPAKGPSYSGAAAHAKAGPEGEGDTSQAVAHPTVQELQDMIAKMTSDREEQAALRQIEVQHLKYQFQQQLQERDQVIESLKEQLQADNMVRQAEQMESLMTEEAMNRSASVCSGSTQTERGSVARGPAAPSIRPGTASTTDPRHAPPATVVIHSSNNTGTLATGTASPRIHGAPSGSLIACNACATSQAQNVLLQSTIDALRKQLSEAQQQNEAATCTTADMAAQLAGAQAQLADAQTQAQAATRSAADLAAQLAKASKSQTHSTVSAPVIGAARLTKSESVNSEKPLHTSVSDLPEVVVQTLRMELAQAQADLQESQDRLAEVKSELQRVTAQATSPTTDAETGSRETHTLREQLSATQKELEQAKAAVESLQRDLSSAQVDLATAHTSLSQATGQITQLQDDLTRSRSEADQLRSDLSQAHTDLEASKADAARSQTELQSCLTQLATLQQSSIDTQQALAASQKLVADKDAHTGELQQQLAAAQQAAAELQTQLAASQEQLRAAQDQQAQAAGEASQSQGEITQASARLVALCSQLEATASPAAAATATAADCVAAAPSSGEAPQNVASTTATSSSPLTTQIDYLSHTVARVLSELSARALHTQDLQTQLATTQHQLADTSSRLTDATGQLADTSSTLTGASKQLEDVTKQFQEAGEARDRACEDATQQRERVGVLETQVGSLESQVASLQTQLGSLGQHNESLQTQVGLLETQVASLQTQVGSLEAQKVSLEAQVGSLETQVTSLQTEVEFLEAQKGSLEAQVGSLQAHVCEWEDEYKGLSEAYKERAGAALAASACSRQHQQTIADLRVKLSEWEARLAESDSKLTAASQTCADLETEVKRLQADNARLQEEAESARQATEPTAAQSTQGAQSSADVSQQALEQTASAIDASDLQAQLDQAKKDLEAEKARTKDACNQVAAHREQLKALQSQHLREVEELKQQAADLHQSLDQSDKRMSDAQSAKATAERELARVKAEVQGLQTKVSVLQAKLKQLTAAESTRQAALQASEKAQQETDLSRMEVAELRGRSMKMQSLIREMASQLQSLQIQLKLQGSLANKLQDEVFALQTDLAETRQGAAEASAAAAEQISVLSAKLATARAQAKRYQDMCESLSGTSAHPSTTPTPTGSLSMLHPFTQHPMSARPRRISTRYSPSQPGYKEAPSDVAVRASVDTVSSSTVATMPAPTPAGIRETVSGSGDLDSYESLLPQPPTVSSYSQSGQKRLSSASGAAASRGPRRISAGLQPSQQSLPGWGSVRSSGALSTGTHSNNQQTVDTLHEDGLVQNGQLMYQRLRKIAAMYQLKVGPGVLGAGPMSRSGLGSNNNATASSNTATAAAGSGPVAAAGTAAAAAAAGPIDAETAQLWAAMSAVLSALESSILRPGSAGGPTTMASRQFSSSKAGSIRSLTATPSASGMMVYNADSGSRRGSSPYRAATPTVAAGAAGVLRVAHKRPESAPPVSKPGGAIKTQ